MAGIGCFQVRRALPSDLNGQLVVFEILLIVRRHPGATALTIPEVGGLIGIGVIAYRCCAFVRTKMTAIEQVAWRIGRSNGLHWKGVASCAEFENTATAQQAAQEAV